MCTKPQVRNSSIKINPTIVGLYEGMIHLPADKMSDRELWLASVVMSESQRKELQRNYLGFDPDPEFDLETSDAADRPPLTEEQALVIHNDTALLQHARKNQEHPPRDYMIEISQADMAYGASVKYVQAIGLRPVYAHGLDYYHIL